MTLRSGLIVGIALGLVGSIVASHLMSHLVWPSKLPLSPAEGSSSKTSTISLERLASDLESEVQARTKLADRIRELDIEISNLRSPNPGVATSTLELTESPKQTESAQAQPAFDENAESSDFDDEVLLSRGIPASEVARLRDLWEEHELERATIADRALREGWFMQNRHRKELAQLDQELREEIDDEEYDRYLYATGEPNRLKAGDVIRGSTASEAGLQRGDFILRYDDVRVFKPGELLLASSRGQIGESVPVVILRDGIEQTVQVRRGPLGVMIKHIRGEPLRD